MAYVAVMLEVVEHKRTLYVFEEVADVLRFIDGAAQNQQCEERMAN
jgi:hypothetical protein